MKLTLIVVSSSRGSCTVLSVSLPTAISSRSVCGSIFPIRSAVISVPEATMEEQCRDGSRDLISLMRLRLVCSLREIRENFSAPSAARILIISPAMAEPAPRTVMFLNFFILLFFLVYMICSGTAVRSIKTFRSLFCTCFL